MRIREEDSGPADEEDRDMPLESDMSDDDDEPIDPCPHCGKAVHEEAEWCHHCGKYLSREDAPQPRVPLWMIVAAMLIGVVIFMWMGGR